MLAGYNFQCVDGNNPWPDPKNAKTDFVRIADLESFNDLDFVKFRSNFTISHHKP